MKRLIFSIATLGLLFAAISVGTVNAVNKVTICHATSAVGNPFVAITVAESSGYAPHLSDNPGNNPLAGHEQDFLLPGEQTAEDCENAANPTDPPTQPPTEAPTDAPTDSPTEAPTDAPTSVPTDAPTEAPTVAPTDEPTEPPVAAQFAATPAVCRLDDPTSRIRLRVLVGLVILRDLDIVIDGNVLTAADVEFDDTTNEAFIPVAPGIHTWAVMDGATTLDSGTVDCPECFGSVVPTPPVVTLPPGAVTATPGTTLPPTDSVGDSTTGSTPLLAVAALALVSALAYVASRRRLSA